MSILKTNWHEDLVRMSHCQTVEDGQKFDEFFEKFCNEAEQPYHEWYLALKDQHLDMSRMLGKTHILKHAYEDRDYYRAYEDPFYRHLDECIHQYMLRLRKEVIVIYAITYHQFPELFDELVESGEDSDGFTHLLPKYHGPYDEWLFQRQLNR